MHKFYLVLLALLVSGCQAKQVIVPAVVHNVNTTKQEIVVEKAHLPIIGEVEPIYFLPMKSPFLARIDTGATTSSLDCRDVEYFERDGDDIYLELPVTITDAILGCKKEIPTLSGNGFIEIKPGTQNYTKLKLKGKGIKGVNSKVAGDMYVIVNVIIPTKLTKKQKDLLKELSETDLETESEFKEFKKSLK